MWIPKQVGGSEVVNQNDYDYTPRAEMGRCGDREALKASA